MANGNNYSSDSEGRLFILFVMGLYLFDGPSDDLASNVVTAIADFQKESL